ncbi:tetratricopeptide repeat protein [Geothrix sp. 21YS21S-4]|uniref:tetratricopeptide repeat protein n=1 Tax=Geothrix sp. 21YS21S-4 TaxID=3068889 RepID=UPI0027B9DC2A|nr:hypothetical protein [Geothrix sp. 21YS21S-4]
MRLPPAAVLLVAALSLAAQHEAPKAAPPASKGPKRMTDAEIGELAKEALRAEDPAAIRGLLARLKDHTFKSSKVPERELVLYAQGMLEARLGNLSGAAVALRKLERQWPNSPFMGEAQTLLAEEAVDQRRFKEAEGRLHRALASDIPSERKRKAQELLLWTLAEQGRPREGLAIVQSLRPLEGQEKPTEKGLVAITEILALSGERSQTEGSRNSFRNLYPKSPLAPRVELAYGQMLGRAGDAKAAAAVLQKLIKDHGATSQADDARLALANLLTDGSLPEAKDLPSAEALLAEVRKGGRKVPRGLGQIVELRVLTGKQQWEEALDLVDRLDSATQDEPEVKTLWKGAWGAWVAQRLEKGYAGELLARLKPGTYAALEPKARTGVAELLASAGLVETLPALLAEVPAKGRPALRKAVLVKLQPEGHPAAVIKLLPPRGDSPDEALARARAEAAQEHWPQLRAALGGARSGGERVKAVLRLLERPLASGETGAQRLKEAEGWLARAPEKGDTREPLAILVADLRFRNGDPKGALALYPPKPAAADQRGWVALMRAESMLKLGQREEAKALVRGARDEQGFKGQRDALARSLGAY